MKKIVRRLTALALAVVLALGTMGQTAFAAMALGTELTQNTVRLADGVTLTHSQWSASNNNLRTENYVTYTPGGQVKPVVFSGNYVASTNTVASAAAQLKAQGYRVAAAINGGFFNPDGTIVGMLMTDGVVRSLDVENYALLGFTNDGKVFIDESPVVKKVSWQTDSGNFTASLAGYNAYRNTKYINGAFLYNKEFSTKVNSATKNVSAILRPVNGGVMKMNSSLVMEVVSVADTAQEGVSFNGYIPDGCYMLYAEYHDGNEWLTNGIRNLKPGQQVTVSVSGVSDQWSNAAYGISGLYSLLRNGQVVSGLPTALNPYTAVGIKADGTAVFYTIDGRQTGYSVGATYAQVAQRLQELGCVTAVALDGGGSTTLGATLPGSTDFTIQNQPSQTGRRVNNSILLVTLQPDYPFIDIANHWSADYVDQLYNLGLTNGYTQPDGTAVFRPNSQLTRGELLTFICRLLNVDTSKYADTVLPFEDAGSIDSWLLPYVKAMYALGVLDGTSRDGKLYADVKSNVTREAAMTMLGRVLATQVKKDLSSFGDSGSVSSWARTYVETLVAQGVVAGSDGKLNPQAYITRGEAAKLLAEINKLDKATLALRPTTPEPGNTDTTPTQKPGVDPGGTFVDPTQRPEMSSQGKPNDKPFDPDFDPSDWTLDLPLFNQ